MEKTRPFLKWAGGKYLQIDLIRQHLPKSKNYIEPFAGAGAIFLNTNYNHYIVNDTNTDLINLYRRLQQEGDKFIKYAQSFFNKKNNTEEVFYKYRDEFNQSNDTRRKSALFLYLNRHCFNGLCRYNNTGGYNVPYGRYSNPYFPKQEMLYFHKKSEKVTFYNNDFRDTFRLATPGDVIYCDPPYVPLSDSANFTRYAKDDFNYADQNDLAKLAHLSSQKGITVLISNHWNDFTQKIYKDAECKIFPATRVISCNINNRNPVAEVLAIFHPN